MKKRLILFAMLLFSWGMTTQAVDLYLIGENSLTHTWSTTNTAGKMTYDATNKVYTITADLTGYFAFTTTLNGNWADINANRYGPNPSGGVPVIGTTTKFGAARGDYSFNATNIAATYKITVSLENETYLLEAQGEVTHTYTVVGSAAACNGLNWGDAFETTSNDMTLVSGTTYRLVVTDCTLETGTTYEYKVVQDKGWTNAWPSSNKTFTVSETAVYTVTYTFNSSTNTVSEVTTKTGEAGTITHTYNVAGAVKLPTDEADATGLFVDGTTLWDATANEMATEDDNIYTLSISDAYITAGSAVQYKVCQDGAWGVSYGWGVEEGSVGSNNAWLYIPYSGFYSIIFTFNATTHVVAATATRTGSTNPVIVKFQKPDTWAKAYLYAWNGESKLTWPGEEMTADGDWMRFIINSGDSIIFNNGLENDALIQSSDIPGVTADVCYIWQDNDAVEDEDCDGVVAAHIYTVAGSAAACNGLTWDEAFDVTTNDMTLVSGTTYQLVVTDCTLEKGTTYEYKVVQDKSWDVSYPLSNKTLTVDETAIYTVTYTFNSSTEEVSHTTTKTGESGEITHTYNVAGAIKLPTDETEVTGLFVDDTTQWEAAANEMSTEDDVNYTITFTDVEIEGGSTILFKVCQDGAWGVSYGWGDEENTVGSNNAWIYIEDSGTYTFTFTFNATTQVVGVTAQRTDITEDTYVIAGSAAIANGETWAATSTANLMVRDGDVYKLTVTEAVLEEGITYEYKVVKNGTDYIPDGMGNNKIITVDETAEYTIEYTFNPTTENITHQLTKTGEAGEITHTYNVAGAIKLPTDEYEATGFFVDGTTLWDATENEMSTEDDVNYTITFTDVEIEAGSTILFKVCQDGAWDVSYGWGDEENTVGSNNVWLYIDENGIYTVTITFNGNTKNVNAVVTKTGDLNPTGVEAVMFDVNAPVYNVLGIQVGKDYKGIVIQNGQKYLNR